MNENLSLYPWDAETFPVLNDRQHDLLCAAQDAGGLVTLEDLCDSCDFGVYDMVGIDFDIQRLLDEQLLRKEESGRHVFYEITPTGCLYLDAPAPEGVEL